MDEYVAPTPTPELENKNEDLEFAKDLVRRAGERICAMLQGNFETRWKEDNTPVTEIDILINSMVLEHLTQRYPSDRVYGEEESSSEVIGEYTWVLDPIDGTQALGKLDTFTVCLARLDADGQPLFSVVYNPLRDELYEAERGGQTLLNGEPVRVSSKNVVKSSYIHFGSALRFPDVVTNGVLYDHLEDAGAKIFNTRSLAHGCVEVAKGEFEAAFIGVRMPFEAASVKLIVEGAGGRVTDLYGKESGRLDGEIRGMLVSNGTEVHDELVAALRSN